MFMANGSQYNVSQVLDPATFEFSQAGYDAAGQINLSIFFAFYYGLTFAALAATLSHVALFHGRCAFCLCNQLKQRFIGSNVVTLNLNIWQIDMAADEGDGERAAEG
jgi:hypothetical protein